ncbi:hypothetical protein K1T71_013952 [Dendrolimus kikuchii]|uniref:Uncharacterized protein n=1 Tax=Dendrolimus kikuchii TaxID=765133 RepID=A0ACC1CG87_9NEOP|nr:hypothetical protein K1T71_013952 [Dendrolimus kikuchii]
MDIVKKIQQFIKYWYVRYLLVTELYMVDTWEKITVQIIILVLFGLFWYFNYSIVMNVISQMRLPHHTEKIL